jgi:hypothetical protein
VNIVYRIQHAKGRNGSLARVLGGLPPEVEIVTDEEIATPSPFRNYLRCLSEAVEPGVTHVCVLQDDVLLCNSFTDRVSVAVGERQRSVVSLFVGGLPNRTRRDFLAALGRGEHWMPIYFRDIHHVVALVWPVELIQSFLAWYPTARIPGAQPPRSDDAVIGFWARTTKNVVWATVPCLVEHPDDVPSTIHTRTRTGRDKGRRAIHFEE